MVLRLRFDAPNDWIGAKCNNLPISRFYDPFFSEEPDEIQDALDFCNGEADGVICPIREDCLIYALTNNCKEGVWGGTSEITRKAIRKRNPPPKGGKPNENWQWQTEEEALKGLVKEQLVQEEDE